jgi:hypothetical protein
LQSCRFLAKASLWLSVLVLFGAAMLIIMDLRQNLWVNREGIED